MGRVLAQSDLVAAMRYSLESTLAYVRSQKTTPHPATQRVADWLARLAPAEATRPVRS